MSIYAGVGTGERLMTSVNATKNDIVPISREEYFLFYGANLNPELNSKLFYHHPPH